jgi:CheY-like chemotaxis protein
MRVFTCLNGREAIELVQSRSFDLVLMDHMMPEMDGIEAVSAIRAMGEGFAELPVVVLTAHAVSGMKEMFLSNGFDDFLSKPIETDKLDAILKKWIGAGKQQSVPEDAEPTEKTEVTKKTGETVSPIFGHSAGAAKAELALQRLDLLNHYRWHFANGLPADQAYYDKFIAVVEILANDGTPWAASPTSAGEMMEQLAAAGRRGDAEEINRILPGACEALGAAMRDEHTADGAGASVKEALMRLKTSLDRGDAQSAAATMRELHEMNGLSEDERELYFFLHDALYMDEMEKAAGGLAVWMKFFGRAG